MAREMTKDDGPVEMPLETLSVAEDAEATADLVVPYKVDLDGEISARMVQALVKYLLYLRGQIPCVYEEFHALVRRQQHEEEAARAAGSRKRKLVGGGMKKARRLVDLADQLLEADLLLLFQRRVRTVAIVFGSTVASPRELWRVDFAGCSSLGASDGTKVTGKAGATLSRDRVVQLCVQKIIRTVLSYATQHFSSSVALTSLHLLVLAEKSDVPVEGFIPKQQLHLRVPKPKKQGKRTHVVHITHGASTTALGDGEYEAEDDSFVWYQSCRPLQGVSRLS